MIKIAIIGFGDIAKNEHLPAIQNSSEFSLVAIVEKNESRHDEISKLTSCSVVKTMTDAVNLGAECVILSTPPEITELLIREAIKQDRSNFHKYKVGNAVDLNITADKFSHAGDYNYLLGQNELMPEQIALNIEKKYKSL